MCELTCWPEMLKSERATKCEDVMGIPSCSSRTSWPVITLGTQTSIPASYKIVSFCDEFTMNTLLW